MAKTVLFCTMAYVLSGAVCAAGSLTAEHLTLDPKANPAAAELLAKPVQDSEKSLLGSINMTLLFEVSHPPGSAHVQQASGYCRRVRWHTRCLPPLTEAAKNNRLWSATC